MRQDWSYRLLDERGFDEKTMKFYRTHGCLRILRTPLKHRFQAI